MARPIAPEVDLRIPVPIVEIVKPFVGMTMPFRVDEAVAFNLFVDIPFVKVVVALPEKVFTSERSVVEETVIEPPSDTEVPLTVIEEFWRKVLVIDEAGRETVEVAVKAPTVRIPAVVEPT